MIPGPVFNVELLALARRRRYYVLRFVYGMFLLYLIWQSGRSVSLAFFDPGNGGYTRQALAYAGAVVFSTFAVAQAVVLLAFAPALVAGAVADERQRKTLHYLLASCLSSGEIVLGKLSARMLFLGAFLGVGLPIVALLSFFGGVDPNQVFLYFGACASTAFLLSAASIAISVHARRAREAVATAYVLELVWLFGPLLVSAILQGMGGPGARFYEWVKPLNEGVGASSPIFVLIKVSRSVILVPPPLYVAVVRMIGIQVLAGAVLAGLAVVRLRPVNRSEGKPPRKLGAALSRQARRFLPRPACGNDPVFWKECFVSRSSAPTKVVRTLAFLGIVAVLVVSTFDFAAPAFRSLRVEGAAVSAYGDEAVDLNGYLRFATTLVSTVWLLATAGAASSTLTSEREGDTWVSLIAAPLAPLEIVRAKMLGAFWAGRWLAMLWLVLLLTGAYLSAVHPFGFVAATAAAAVYLWFACALGTFCSLRCRNSTRSLVATITTLLVCNGLYLLPLLPFQTHGSIWALGVSPFVSGTSLLSYPDVQAFFEPGTPVYPSGQRLESWYDYALMYMASLAVYAAASLALTYYLVVNFDDAINRPRTDGGRPPRKRGGDFAAEDYAKAGGEMTGVS